MGLATAVWTYSVGPGASAATPGAARELSTARGRVLTRRIGGHHFAQFTLSGSVTGGGQADDENAEVEVGKSDLWIWRDGILVGRHRVVSWYPQVDADKWTITYQTVDYRGQLLLDAKLEPTVPTWPSLTDQAVIAWQLVQHRQAQTGGDWGITDGTGSSSGQNRVETDLTAGKPIGEAIDALAMRSNGFDWEVDPLMALNRWSPRRTRTLGVVLDYGGMVAEFSGTSPEWGNAVVFTGSDETTPVTTATAGVGTDERGRRTMFGSSPSQTNQTNLAANAAGLLADVSTPNHDWAVRLTPGRWEGDAALTLGDIVELRLAPVGFSSPCRVVEMQHVAGDDGVETVSLGLREEEP